MKITLPILAMFLFTISTNAQVNVGLEVGGGINGIISDDIHNSASMTERAGIIINYSPKKKAGILFESGVYYTYKGYDMSGFSPDDTALTHLNANMNGIEIPFMFGRVYRINTDNSTAKFIFKGGAYFNCGINGKGTAVWESNGTRQEGRVSNVFKNQSFSENLFKGYNRFDCGLRLGAEFLIKDYSIRLSYSLGVLKVHPSYGKAANSDLSITFACFFL